MYKPAKQRVEDAIIPALLDAIMSQNPKGFEDAIIALRADIKGEIGSDQKLIRRVHRAQSAISKYFIKHNWPTRKAFMLLSALADKLHQANVVCFRDSTKEVIKFIDDTIVGAYDRMPEIKKIDASAIKQVPKVLGILEKQGLFV